MHSLSNYNYSTILSIVDRCCSARLRGRALLISDGYRGCMKFPFAHSDQEQSLICIVPKRISHANVATIATTGTTVCT